jgi:hypothetical protein
MLIDRSPVSSENDGMDRSDSCARQHGHDQLEDHRHVDSNSVALKTTINKKFSFVFKNNKNKNNNKQKNLVLFSRLGSKDSLLMFDGVISFAVLDYFKSNKYHIKVKRSIGNKNQSQVKTLVPKTF